MESLNLTFGLELEFVVAYPVGQYANSPQTDPDCAVRTHIIQLLQEAGLSVNGLIPPFNYQFWAVGTDGSIKAEPEDQFLPRWNDFRFSAVELITPTFCWSQSAAAFQQLHIALQKIQREFTAFTNRSCGMHVHVGHGQWGFPRSTLKKFAQVVTAFERQLAAIHPFHRVNNVHCRPPSSNFKSDDLVQNILSLQDARNSKALIKSMSCCPHGSTRGFAYNLRNLITNGAPPTIEFRQHQGTLSVLDCAAWASLAVSLVARCHELTTADLRLLLFRGVSRSPPALFDLLVALDLQDHATHFGLGTLHEHPVGPLTYEGEAYVAEPETDVEMSNASQHPENASGPAPPTPPMTAQDQVASDAEMCRRLCLNLRPRRSKPATTLKAAADNDEMDWDTEYALYDGLRGEELPQDDDEDEDY